MLRLLRFPEILRSVLSDGVEGVVLMTTEGSILSAVSLNKNDSSETVVAAVSSCIYSNYSQGGNSYDTSLFLLKLDSGLYAITPAGRGYLLVAYGKSSGLAIGLLRGRMDALSKYFTRIFEQMKQN